MAGNPELECLDSAKYIYLRELSEPRDNSLHVVMQEAVVNPAGLVASHAGLPELAEILKDASPIESTDACRTFELTGKVTWRIWSPSNASVRVVAISMKYSPANCFESIPSHITSIT
jgi:hypothetical protein